MIVISDWPESVISTETFIQLKVTVKLAVTELLKKKT